MLDGSWTLRGYLSVYNCRRGTWVLTCEEMTEPPKQLRIEADKVGIKPDEFFVVDIGETYRTTPEK